MFTQLDMVTSCKVCPVAYYANLYYMHSRAGQLMLSALQLVPTPLNKATAYKLWKKKSKLQDL